MRPRLYTPRMTWFCKANVTISDERNERLLVLMPTKKDAERAIGAFCELKISCVVCSDVPHLCDEIKAGAGAALLPEESFFSKGIECLRDALQAEPAWSGFPLIVLAREGRRSVTLPDDLALNITLVERPVRMVTLKSVIETALRHRRRQYQLRAVLDDLEQANQELESRVRQRTHKLQEIVADLEGYSYSISHDMRAPLRAMQAYARALQEELGPSLENPHRHYLDRISNAAVRLDKLITDVLSYSRLTRAEIRLAPVALDQLVFDITHHYPSLQIAEIHIVKNLGTVLAAEALLTQAIANLLTNAAKFVGPGVKPMIRIWSERVQDVHPGTSSDPDIPATASFIRLFIKDNGIGIDPKDHEGIFRIFSRVYSEKEYEGTGIGLSIVKKAVERMGGAIGLESQAGRGSTFRIELPEAPTSIP